MEFEDDCIEKEEEEEGEEDDDEKEDDEKQDESTQFLQTQKNHFFDLQDHLERYCNVLSVLGFNSAKYDTILRKSYLLPFLVTERGFEPIVIKKVDQFV